MDNGDLVDYKHLNLNCMGIYGVWSGYFMRTQDIVFGFFLVVIKVSVCTLMS